MNCTNTTDWFNGPVFPLATIFKEKYIECQINWKSKQSFRKTNHNVRIARFPIYGMSFWMSENVRSLIWMKKTLKSQTQFKWTKRKFWEDGITQSFSWRLGWQTNGLQANQIFKISNEKTRGSANIAETLPSEYRLTVARREWLII